MNPYDGASFSTLPISLPLGEMEEVKVLSLPLPSVPPCFTITFLTTGGACFMNATFAMRRSPVNLCSTKSKETTSPSFNLGHESLKSLPVNSRISVVGLGEDFSAVPSESLEVSPSPSPPSPPSPDASPASALFAISTRPPYESIFVRPLNARTIVPSTAFASIIGALSSSVSMVTSSAFALPSLSLGLDPAAASRAMYLTSSPAQRSSIPRPRTSEAWKNNCGPCRLNPRTNPKLSRTVTTTPYSHSFELPP